MTPDVFDPIRLRKGATSIVEVDLTSFDFQGGSVVVAFYDRLSGEVIKDWVFETPEVHHCVFEDEFTEALLTGSTAYQYDIMWHIDDERFAQCAPSPVIVEDTVGGFPYDPAN